MEEAQLVLERHEQQLKILERDISDLKAVQAEIRTIFPFPAKQSTYTSGLYV